MHTLIKDCRESLIFVCYIIAYGATVTFIFYIVRCVIATNLHITEVFTSQALSFNGATQFKINQ